MGFFRVRPATTVGHYEIVATADVHDPRNGGQLLYQSGNVVPYSEVATKAEAERYSEYLDSIYAPVSVAGVQPSAT